MGNADGVIIQGDGPLFYFDHNPLCQFLAKAKIGCRPEEIWGRISQLDLVYCEQTNTPNPLENFNNSVPEKISKDIDIDFNKIDVGDGSLVTEYETTAPSTESLTCPDCGEVFDGIMAAAHLGRHRAKHPQVEIETVGA